MVWSTLARRSAHLREARFRVSKSRKSGLFNPWRRKKGERKKETRDFSLFTFVSFSRFEERTFRCLANSSKFLEEERNWKDRKYHRAGNILTENKKKGREQSNLQRCVDGGQTVGGKAIVNEFDGRWEVINDDTDVISRN